MPSTDFSDPLLNQLVEEGLLSQGQADEVVDEHTRTGRVIRELIIEMGMITEDQLLEVIAMLLGTHVVNLMATDIPQKVIKSIPGSTARMYNVVPVEITPGGVVLATFDLLSPEIVDELMFVLTRDIEFVVAREEDINTYVNRFYGDDSESVTDMLTELESELEDAQKLLEYNDKGESIEIEAAANLTPVVRFVNLVLYQAVRDRASDIHFEPFENEFKIRYRVDGALYEMAPPPKHLALPVTSRIKVISGLDIAERRLPQDGRIQLNIAGRTIDFRVSTLPTQFGESVVLRVLDKGVVQLDLENVGMSEDVYKDFKEDVSKPNGIVIVTGPTGSGKTTTLYSALRLLNTVGVKLLTAEEPVEYDIEGIIQVPVVSAVGQTFASALRAFLRQDPDIIMVGEIRDMETAEIAIRASLTGHLVLSTLHTNDAPGAVTRLIDMGLGPFLISSTVESVLGQRLVRTVCKNCATPYTPDADMLDRLNLTPADVGDRQFYYGSGCPTCNETGYKGRKGIFEYLRMTDAVRDLINARKPTIVIRDKAVEQGMQTLRADGVRAVLDGYTTAEEILKYT